MSSHTLPQIRSVRESVAYSIFRTLQPVYVFARRGRIPWKTTQAELGEMPPGTLGNDLYLFLSRNKLELLSKIEFHDVYHVLFEYDASLKEETMVQFLPLGNGKLSLPLLICIAISASLYPENWPEFKKAFLRGRAAKTFHDWDFEPFLEEKTEDVRELIFGKAEN